MSVSVTGGTGSYTYLWDDVNGSTTSSVSGLAAGTYNVTVEDANNCIAVSSATISEPALLLANATGSEVLCNGDMGAGTVSASPSGGTAGYTYNWEDSNNQFVSQSMSVGGLDVGIYNVTVTDANGCTAIGSAAVTEPSGLTLSMTGDALSCNGDMDGTVSVTVTGGTGAYMYVWDDTNASTTASVGGLGAGTYEVTITDANNCTYTDSYEVTEPSAALSLTAAGSVLDCNGDVDGIVSVTVTGGTSSYSYLWDDVNGSTTASVSGLGAGSYEVLVTDANGCTSTVTAVVSEPTAVEVTTINVIDVACNGDASGSAEASATGGTEAGDYDYLWSDGQTTAIALNLAAGTYTVTVTDDNGCTAETSVTIGESTDLVLTGDVTNVACNGASTR